MALRNCYWDFDWLDWDLLWYHQSCCSWNGQVWMIDFEDLDSNWNSTGWESSRRLRLDFTAWSRNFASFSGFIAPLQSTYQLSWRMMRNQGLFGSSWWKSWESQQLKPMPFFLQLNGKAVSWIKLNSCSTNIYDNFKPNFLPPPSERSTSLICL